MKELVITLYINEYKCDDSIYEDDSCIDVEYEVEVTDNVAVEIGDWYDPIDKWVENKKEEIYDSGDWYIDPADSVETKSYRVAAKLVDGVWYVNS